MEEFQKNDPYIQRVLDNSTVNSNKKRQASKEEIGNSINKDDSNASKEIQYPLEDLLN